ncbi:alpha/beta fold hydrolase [Shimia biformata]|uniref:alpha/beta fold hydrolase n=1 Tax=Shimia biformata TaxID=1294299 RepID=UPI0019529868|nr:alpha/beta fold hydrolase [Shimia biformata]
MPHSAFLALPGHELHVTEWGSPTNPALVMWHGLARTGRDFDELAEALSDQWFVICPDTPGRGMSSWASDPTRHYGPAHFADLAAAMLDHYGIEACDWLGTSMGGLIGIHFATGPYKTRIRRLIINDIGPEIPAPAVERILTYAVELPEFASFAEGEDWLRQVYAPFGPAGDAFWARMAETSLRRKGNGKLTLHYDPAMVRFLSDYPDELDNWARFNALDLPVHVIWGTQSDILTADILERMRAAPCNPTVWDVPDCGHAPTLSREADIARVRQMLTS